MKRILICGETRQRALNWCGENGIDPYSRWTYLIHSPNGGRGFVVEPDDRVVFVGDVESRPDYEMIVFSLLPVLHEVGGMDFVEHVE